MTLDQMERHQIRSIADFIMPSRANMFAPASVLRFNLRRHVQHLRVDDKDIYWEGVRSLDREEVRSPIDFRPFYHRFATDFSRLWRRSSQRALNEACAVGLGGRLPRAGQCSARG